MTYKIVDKLTNEVLDRGFRNFPAAHANLSRFRLYPKDQNIIVEKEEEKPCKICKGKGLYYSNKSKKIIKCGCKENEK